MWLWMETTCTHINWNCSLPERLPYSRTSEKILFFHHLWRRVADWTGLYIKRKTTNNNKDVKVSFDCALSWNLVVKSSYINFLGTLHRQQKVVWSIKNNWYPSACNQKHFYYKGILARPSVPFSLTPAICRQEIQIKVKSITSDDKSMTIETSRMSALSMGQYCEKFESS